MLHGTLYRVNYFRKDLLNVNTKEIVKFGVKKSKNFSVKVVSK